MSAPRSGAALFSRYICAHSTRHLKQDRSMLISTRRAALVALASTALVAGCSDDSSGPSPSDHPAAMLTIGSFDSVSFEYETSNLLAAVQQAGFPLDTSSATDSTSMAELLAGKDLLFLPESDANFDVGTQALVLAWVDAGGTIVMVGGYEQLNWVNTAFGWSLSSADDFSSRHPMPKTGNAHGTPFADGPSTIPGNDGGATLSVPSMPDDGIAVYLGEDGDNDASVAILPYGDGRLVYFGWDWYDGTPRGLQDGGWYKLLKLTAGF
jgi:hypothetical protein